MLFYTHVAFSILIGLFLIDNVFVSNKIVFFIFLVLFSSFPDIDKSNSKIGKKFGIFSKLINFFVGHRSFFHSLLFIFLGYALLSVFSDLIAFAFLIGTASHLVLDSMTPAGVAVFYPIQYRFKGRIKTSSLAEKVLFLLFSLLIIIKLSTGHV